MHLALFYYFDGVYWSIWCKIASDNIPIIS